MHEKFLQKAIEESKKSIAVGGFPVGAVVVEDERVISFGISNGKQLNDPTSHAEIVAIRMACQKKQSRCLKNVVLYSSLEPCLMCFNASVWASIPKIIYACSRNRVSKQHYEGNHNLVSINEAMRYLIKLIHFRELENEALQVIESWENNF